MTKCGRYGLTPAEFNYSPSTIRRSAQRNLKRLDTTYLDAVYLHDTEMVAEEVMSERDGNHSTALGEGGKRMASCRGKRGRSGERVIGRSSKCMAN